jgi:hypothetical protein
MRTLLNEVPYYADNMDIGTPPFHGWPDLFLAGDMAAEAQCPANGSFLPTMRRT